MTYNKILFDLDGTLTDSQEGITLSVIYALESLSVEVPPSEVLKKFIGPPLKESFMKYCGLSEENADLAINKYRERFVVTGIYENKLYDGIEKLLKRLKAGGKTLILATSKPEVFALIILEHFGIKEYFDYIAGSDLDGARITKSDVISCALEQSSILDMQSVVMVGDREHDVLGAKSFGIPCIGVLYGYGSRAELEDAGAKLIVETVEELELLLNN